VHPHIANGRSSAGSIHSLGQVPPEKSRKPSQHISKRQTTNLVAAFEFAETIGLPLNVSADIAWIFFAGIADDRTRFARCQQRLSKWALRHGFPLTMIWTREVGKNGSPHTHVLLLLPTSSRTKRSNKFSIVPLNPKEALSTTRPSSSKQHTNRWENFSTTSKAPTPNTPATSTSGQRTKDFFPESAPASPRTLDQELGESPILEKWSSRASILLTISRLPAKLE
jgi:hypothetical protein